MASSTGVALAEDAPTPMKKFSEIADTMERLIKAVDRLSDVVDALPKAGKDGLDEYDRKSIEEEEAWETVRDTGKEQQKETVDSWKDELNNLLVFAGLFSAVVTAFTVESYTWLQQDPGDASNALLAQLSLQLSMFMITFAGSPPSSAFANSTNPPLSLSDVQSSFSPVSYAVSVNTLWVLSLTLSLISAFFAIAAQQWLRQLHLPPEMPVRRAVQLLEARKDGLKTWQVPSIIALLPLLLQIAVIFFLVGLFLLLRSLNNTVATAFGSVAVVGLLAFLTTVFVPLFTSQCPYKTPLVPTVAVVLQCLSYPAAALSLPFVILLKISLRPPAWEMLFYENCISYSTYRHSLVAHNIYDHTLLPYLKNFGRHMFVDMGQFWLTREYHSICPRNKDAPDTDPIILGLERSLLIQTFLSTPPRCSSKVSELLDGSEGDTSVRVIQDTVVSSLRGFRTGLKWSDLIPEYKLDPKMAPYIGKWLSARHHRLLWQYLQQRDWKQDGEVAPDDSRCLIVFHELDKTFPATRPRYARHLLQICAQQEPSGVGWVGDAVPACLVLDLILNRGYVPDEGDADALLAFASNVYGKYRGDLGDHDKRRLFLVSTALALIAANKSGAAHLDGITSVVNTLAGALDEESTKRYAVYELQWYYKDGSNWSHEYPEFMSPAGIMQTLCEALSYYAASPLLSPSPRHLRGLARILTALRAICSDPAYAEKPELLEARQHLDALNLQMERIKAAVCGTDDTDVESTMQALVRAEARLQRADTDDDGDHTLVISSSTGSPNGTSGVPPSSASAVTTGTISPAQTVNQEPADRAETNGAHAGPLHNSSLTDCSNLPQPSSSPTTFVNAVVVSCTLKEREGEAQAPNIPLLVGRMQEAQTEPPSPPAVEEASASDHGTGAPSAADADGVGEHCMTIGPILPAQTDDPGSVDSAVRGHEPVLESSNEYTDSNLARPPPVENSTGRDLAVSRGKSAAAFSREPDNTQKNRALSSHFPTSEPQETQDIQHIDSFKALSGPHDTEEISLVSDADSDDGTAIDDHNFRDEGDGGVETRGYGGGGGIEHNGTMSGEFYAHRQDARPTAALTTTAVSSGRADEPETAQVVTLEDNHADLRSNRPTSSNNGSAEDVDESLPADLAAVTPGSLGETEATQPVSTGESNVAEDESLAHDEDGSTTAMNAGASDDVTHDPSLEA